MRVVVMAGGAGSRMGGVEKPLLRVCGEPVLDRVVRAASPLGEVVVAASPASVGVALRALDLGVEAMVTPGEGYSRDLEYAVSKAGTPALVLPGDLPLIDPESLLAVASLLSSSRAQVTTLVIKEGCLPGKQGPLGISLIRGLDWSSYASVEACPGWELYDIDTWLDVFRVEEVCEG